jgi:hypothetical protein
MTSQTANGLAAVTARFATLLDQMLRGK